VGAIFFMTLLHAETSFNAGTMAVINNYLLSSESDLSYDTKVGNVQNLKVRNNRMTQEYYLVMALVDKVTDETLNSGAWSDPKTWKSGTVPADGARVLIHSQHRVTLNSELHTHLRTIKLEGELAFNPHKNTQLIVDTMVTTSHSILRIGEPKIPIDADKKAQIIIHDYDDEGMVVSDTKSPDYDPLRIGQGILTNGLFLAHGSYKTPYVEIEGSGVKKGALEIALRDEIEGWRVGDDVIILGTSPDANESEYRKISQINENSIILQSALAYDHIVPETTIEKLDLKVHIANVTRNIIIKSDPASLEGRGNQNSPENVEHRGHVLFMHNNNVNINYAQFKDLGRTNKRYHLDETEFASDADDAEVSKIGSNQAARYPVHFHRAGFDGKLGRITGCVVLGSPGWGYVNHSSNVVMRDNIAYHVYGSSFITEAGDENGKFIANMAIETHGYGRSSVRGWKDRRDRDDWGFGGNGFWLLGPNVDIVSNIVNGSSNSAFAFTRTTIDSVTGVVDSQSHQEKAYSKVSLKSFVNNVAYGNAGGVFGILSGTRSSGSEVIKGLLAYANRPLITSSDANKGELISWWYPSNVTLEDVTLVGDIYHPQYTGIGTQTKLRRTLIKNARIDGLYTGIHIPIYVGQNIIENGYFNNIINMYYGHGAANHGADTLIKGAIVYGDLPTDVQQYKVKFGLNIKDTSTKNYWARQFLPFNVVYAPDGEVPLKLYLTKEQSADYVIEVGDSSYKGKTNQWRVDNGDAPVGGLLLPQDSFSVEGMQNVSATKLQ
jgi:hypothetical protein